MDREEFQKILEKYNKGQANDEEKQIIIRFENHRKESNLAFWERWSDEEEKEVKTDILSSISEEIVDFEYNKKREKRSQIRWSVAASLLLLGIFTGILLINESKEVNQEEIQISYVTKTAKRGQKLTVRLSDGSVVKLNSESFITYPESFTTLDKREIKLSGEAFFEVTEDKSKPFVITTGELRTTVLGTSFNVRAYPEDESVAVTVVTGKVQVKAGNQLSAASIDTQAVEVLTPGQQAIFNKETMSLKTAAININNCLGWKNGILFFDRTSLEDAAKTLERWYDIDITFRNEGIKNCVINGKFKNDQLQNMLDNIQFLTGVEYEFFDEKRIVLSGTSCN